MFFSSPVCFSVVVVAELARLTRQSKLCYYILGTMKTLKNICFLPLAFGLMISAWPEFSSAQFSETINLPQVLLAHTAVISENRIYVAGGLSDTGGIRGAGGFLNNVYYSAEINPDGTLSEWKVANNMPEFLGLGLHATVVYNQTIYVLGGNNMFGPRNVVYYASINGDGTLSSWQSANPMPKRLMGHAAVLSGNRIYVMGGIIRSVGSTSEVYWAEILPDKTLGAWNQTTALPVKLFGHKAAIFASRIYVAGGNYGHTLYTNEGLPAPENSSAVYASDINPDGSLGQWQSISELPEPVSFHALAATSKNIYVFGGHNTNGVLNAVYFAPVLNDGSLGSWQALDALPKNLLALAAVSSEKYIYALGGGDAYIDGPQSNIYYMQIQNSIKAFVKIVPSVINKKSHGRWIMAIVGIPEADARDIVYGSVRISAVNGKPISPIYADSSWRNKFHEGDYDGEYEDGESERFGALLGHKYAMFKFSRQKVAEVVEEGQVTLKIEGNLKDGKTFAGENTNWVLSKSKFFSKFLEARAGKRKTHFKAEADIPAGAFPGNPELVMTIEEEDNNTLSNKEKEARDESKGKKNLVEVSKPVKFGPHGIGFEKPVTIALPYDSAKLPEGVKAKNLKICHWNAQSAEWEELDSRVSEEENLVRADITHFSVYQVMAGGVENSGPAPDPDFKLNEVYAYPNPAKAGEKPKIHIEASSGEKVLIKIYTVSGRLVKEAAVTGVPSLIEDGNGSENAYEYEVIEELASGVYYYLIEVSKGAQKLKASGKLALLR